jgi:hypothetical protein
MEKREPLKKKRQVINVFVVEKSETVNSATTGKRLVKAKQISIFHAFASIESIDENRSG